MLAALLAASCAGKPDKRILRIPESSDTTDNTRDYLIVDYKDKDQGEAIPGWVSLFLAEGVRGVEALVEFQDRFVFISRNEGNSFRALTQWAAGFSPIQDFPRLAAARIETRFSSSIPHPDEEYGVFFETLIRVSSDTLWEGASRNDDFWIQRQGIPNEEEPPEMEEAENQNPSIEAWEFFILVSIEKSLFASQLDLIFNNIQVQPNPSRDQIAAVNKVKDRFYDGF